MQESEAFHLIRTMVEQDLKLQGFASKEFAERAAEAYTIVLKSPYVAVNPGYKWMVTPLRRAAPYPPRNRTEEVRVVIHIL